MADMNLLGQGMDSSALEKLKALLAERNASGMLNMAPKTPEPTSMMPTKAPTSEPGQMYGDDLSGPPMDTDKDSVIDALDQLQQTRAVPGSMQEKLKMFLQKRAYSNLPQNTEY